MRMQSLIAAALLAAAPLVQAEITVIVNAANNATLDDDTIASLFLGQAKSFPGGAGEAVPVNQREAAAAAQEFSTRFLKKTAPQLRAFWAKQVFTGAGRPPKELDGDEAVLKFVAATPGAIGYIEGNKLGPGVKAVKR